MRQLLIFTFCSAALACSLSTKVDPEGYACDLGDVCPSGFACINGICHSIAPMCTDGCVTPPDAVCNSNGTQTVFDTPGSCMNGQCVYPTHMRNCSMGCTNGVCLGDPCDGVTCDTPTASSCRDNMTLATFIAPGTCNNGVCTYAEKDVACTQGCLANQCQGQSLCTGVVCTTPPSNVCMGNSARTYNAAGTCDGTSGQCHYSFTDTACPSGCSNGACATTMLNFTQTMPRLKFAVRGVDQAPASMGGTALVVGANGQAMKWNGTSFTAVASGTTSATLNAVWFSSANTAWVVGSNRTVLHYTAGTLNAVSGTGLSGSANIMGVHGLSDTNVAIASDDGQWSLWNGTSWSGGQLSNSNTYDLRSVYVDPAGHVRIAGACDGVPCVAYRSVSSLSWFEDTDSAASDPFNAVGPSPTTSLTVNLAWAGRSASSVLREHDGDVGMFSTPSAPVISDGSIWGITGAELGAGTSRVLFLLSDAHLYRFGNGALDPALADLYFGAQSMSQNESSGVLVAETDRTNSVNNIYHRSATVDEMLDLGESWATVTSLGQSLVMVSGFGDLGVRNPGDSVWHLRRGPVFTALDATGQNGTGVVIVGAGGGIELATAAGFTALSSPTSQDLDAVCRVSDTEAYAVGGAGAIVDINGNNHTAKAMTSPSSSRLLAVDCPSTQNAVACGDGGAVLMLSGGGWTALPSFPGGASLTACRLSGSTVFAAGDNVFGSLDTSVSGAAWKTLPAAAKLHSLTLFAPNDAYALSGSSSITHFDGMNWSSRFTLSSQGSLVGGGQVGGKVVYAGSLGVLVESQ